MSQKLGDFIFLLNIIFHISITFSKTHTWILILFSIYFVLFFPWSFLKGSNYFSLQASYSKAGTWRHVLCFRSVFSMPLIWGGSLTQILKIWYPRFFVLSTVSLSQSLSNLFRPVGLLRPSFSLYWLYTTENAPRNSPVTYLLLLWRFVGYYFPHSIIPSLFNSLTQDLTAMFILAFTPVVKFGLLSLSIFSTSFDVHIFKHRVSDLYIIYFSLLLKFSQLW